MSDDYRQRYYDSYIFSLQESIIPTSDGFSIKSHLCKHIIDNHFPKAKDASIFELGCGHGAMIHHARRRGYGNFKGADLSQQQVDAALSLGIKGVMLGDGFELLDKEADESLDVIIAIDLIEHLTHVELLKWLDLIYSKLRVGGRLIVHTPNACGIFSGRMRYGDATHQMSFTQKSIRQIFRVARFSDIECYESGPFPHGFISTIRKILWLGVRSILSFVLAIESGSGKEIFTENLIAIAKKI